MKLVELRPKKCYGKALWRNPDVVRDMIHRRSMGETYRSIGESYGVTQMHVWITLNKIIPTHCN